MLKDIKTDIEILTYKRPKYIYVPKSDITAYELSQIIKVFLLISDKRYYAAETMLDSCNKNIKRHFELKK